ncbi:MAG: FtsQ-type POTRA domain-containing protein [Clostridia bacterium]|nr:FtsQ-type POTRA domain-containing protein [Clostridia bacterium]MDD4047272.1 FtsQ-type POTRA domain-containing protein [Clostridia bacterium]
MGNVTYLRRKRKGCAPFIGWGIFLLVCVLFSLYFFINSALFNLKSVKIDGCCIATHEEVLKLSGLTLGTNLFKIDLQELNDKVKMHPIIKSLIVRREYPNILNITVTERSPVALIVGDGAYFAVDIEGICIRKVQNLQELNFPVISGVVVGGKEQKPGMDLSTSGLEAALELIHCMDKVFLANIAEIEASSAYSLTIKTIQGVEIRFGEPTELERKFKIIEELLVKNGEIINNQTVEYIDLRYKSLPVIKKRKI